MWKTNLLHLIQILYECGISLIIFVYIDMMYIWWHFYIQFILYLLSGVIKYIYILSTIDLESTSVMLLDLGVVNIKFGIKITFMNYINPGDSVCTE